MYEECYRCGRKMEPPAYCHPCLRVENERGKAATLHNVKIRALCLMAVKILKRTVPTKPVAEVLLLLHKALEEIA